MIQTVVPRSYVLRVIDPRSDLVTKVRRVLSFFGGFD